MFVVSGMGMACSGARIRVLLKRIAHVFARSIGLLNDILKIICKKRVGADNDGGVIAPGKVA